MDLACFTLIVDDIVYPDGTTAMARLGGGGPQTLWGYKLAAGRQDTSIGLAAGVGADLPPHCKAWLAELGCDLSGLLDTQLPTPRAWQVLELDGRRTQVWRSPECPALYQQLRPMFDQLPASFERARSYHLGIHAAHPPMRLLAALRDAAHAHGGMLSVEPYTACDAPPDPGDLSALLALVDVFSPNEAEAVSIVGPGTPEQLVARLLALGAPLVALRCGADGALVARQGEEQGWRVPAVPGTRVVDVTGCGNAFCGALLRTLQAGGELREAAAWGCAAGSLMAEHAGVPPATPGGEAFQREAAARLQALRPLARPVRVLAAMPQVARRSGARRLPAGGSKGRPTARSGGWRAPRGVWA